MLPVEYYHVVFTLPAPVAALAWYNKALMYRLLFETAAQTLCTIAADPQPLGARIGATLVLHTWGSALTHHPHVHGIVPGGGLSPDGTRWIACRRGFFLPVRVLSRLFRRRFLLHVLPTGFHRIRHYGILANAKRKANLALARTLLHVPPPVAAKQIAEPIAPTFICRHCGAPMAITAIFLPIHPIQAPPRHQGAPP